MNCEHLRQAFELYALGLAEPEEREEIEAHLGRNCPECTANMKGALATNAMLLSLSPAARPSSKLRRRVMASVGVERSSFWSWLPALAAVAMLAVALWLGNEEQVRTVQLADARRSILAISADRDRLSQAVEFLNDATTRQVNFGRGNPVPPSGNVLVNPRLGVLLIASNLPTLPEGRIYQMWVIPKGANAAPRPAGLFEAAQGRTGFHVLSGAIDLASLAAVAVTVEPSAGSPAPTTTPLIVAAL